MSESPSFIFTDAVDGDEVWVGIRSVEGAVGLTLSKKSDGDLEVYLPDEAAARLAAILGDSGSG